jgi:hypothetical protein
MKNDLATNSAVIVYLKRSARKRNYYPPEDRLKRDLNLRLLTRKPDGVIYGPLNPSTTRGMTNDQTRNPNQ